MRLVSITGFGQSGKTARVKDKALQVVVSGPPWWILLNWTEISELARLILSDLPPRGVGEVRVVSSLLAT